MTLEAPVGWCQRRGSGRKRVVSWKGRRTESAAATTQVCTEPPCLCTLPTSQAQGIHEVPLRTWHWIATISSLLDWARSIRLTALLSPRRCDKTQSSAAGRSLHKLESDYVPESLKLNQIIREHGALEIRCPGYPARTHGTPQSLEKRQRTTTQFPKVCSRWLWKRKVFK